jgi:hypothetical protein
MLHAAGAFQAMGFTTIAVSLSALCSRAHGLQVVQPLFFFLAEQIDLAGQQAEEEPALRIAYCDVNESCCSPVAVYGLIKVLKQQYSSSSTGGNDGDLWSALQQVCIILQNGKMLPALWC